MKNLDGKTKVQVNADITATGKVWEGYGKKKIYFSLFFRTSGSGNSRWNQLCYDVAKDEFTSCSKNYADNPSLSNTAWDKFKSELKSAFEIKE